MIPARSTLPAATTKSGKSKRALSGGGCETSIVKTALAVTGGEYESSTLADNVKVDSVFAPAPILHNTPVVVLTDMYDGALSRSE